MKKIITFVCIVLASLFLTSCSNKNESKKLKLGLVIDVSGIDDKSFNQSAWEAILEFVKKNNIPTTNYNYTHSMTKKEYIPNLSMYADSNMDLIISPGYYFIEPLKIVAKKYPNQKFLLLDAVSEEPNVLSITFAANEGSFLVGVLAGLKAKDAGYDTVGFLGGLDILTVREFEAGFETGVHLIEPNIKILIEYAKDFANPLAGKELANKMFSNGAKIIFNVAGGTGNGLIDEAKSRAANKEDVWVIGVDKDQYKDGIYKNGKSVILTSMIKNIKIATYNTIQSVKNNTFEGIHKIYSLKNDGVGIPNNNPNLKQEWIEKVESYKKDIIQGQIIVPTIPNRIKHN